VHRTCTAKALFGQRLSLAASAQTYMTASNTFRAGLGGRPAPALRTFALSVLRSRTGINGSTRSQNSSLTSPDSTGLRVTMHSHLAA